MNVLAKFVQLFNDEAAAVEGAGGVTVPVPVVSGAAEVTSPSELAPGEAAALVEAAKAKGVVDDLAARHAAAVAAVEELTRQRSALSRDLAAGDGGEDAFTRVCGALDVGQARLEALGQLLAEARAASSQAYAALAEAERPRHEAARRQRVADATAKAQATKDRFLELYAQAAAQLARLADELDALVVLDANAGFNVGYSLRVVEGDPWLRLSRAGWVLRPRTAGCPTEFKLFAAAPPAGR